LTSSGVDDKYRAYVNSVDGELNKRLSESLEFIRWRESVKKDSVVFFKPNFTFPYYKEGITTTPALLKCLLALVKERSSRVIVGESNGGNHSFKAEEAFKGHGMYEACAELDVELVNLSNLPSRFVEAEVQSKKVKIQLPKILLDDVDCFISVPVLKVHVMTGVSLGIKNLWGCYPDTMRCLYHQNLERKLALMAKLLNPKITVIDGLYALDGHGPMFGKPKKTDLILASDNVVAADALGARIMGVPLKKAKHILTAEKTGVGTSGLDNIVINTNWKSYEHHFKITKTLIDSASSLLFQSHTAAKLVMDSPITPLIYGVVAGVLRSKEEKAVASQLNTRRSYI
jgi:uncharacterized protein (DUF362 family)